MTDDVAPPPHSDTWTSVSISFNPLPLPEQPSALIPPPLPVTHSGARALAPPPPLSAKGELSD
ncbi:hypothetical protein TIFTF001_003280 [Ficus carica]|uniref:Uncharacterized protein n=1 Tax=Ficus carica TaxID=3494 RepID=A0AA87ZR24_FICCA|nr:hypothetical protein TIFTF001_003280 [Ficus carica]